MSLHRARLLMALTALMALATAACGDSSRPSGTPTQGPGSRADFIARADRECAAAHAQLDQRPAPKTLPEVVSYLDTTIRVSSDLDSRLRRLALPRDDAATATAVLNDFQTLVAKAKEVRQSAAAGAAVATDKGVTELSQLVSAVSVKASEFGFKVCGVPAPVASPSAA